MVRQYYPATSGPDRLDRIHFFAMDWSQVQETGKRYYRKRKADLIDRNHVKRSFMSAYGRHKASQWRGPPPKYWAARGFVSRRRGVKMPYRR